MRPSSSTPGDLRDGHDSVKSAVGEQAAGWYSSGRRLKSHSKQGDQVRKGPLQGYRILELASMGPGPFCGMILADLGAEVVRIERLDGSVDEEHAASDYLARGRRSVALDLKDPASVELVLRLAERADGMFEGFRPGVTERLGLGPEVCLERNPCLVYGRMTGYGQDGPLAHLAGHDINYIAIAGALDAIGRAGERPIPPLNLIGDFGGGGMLLAVGLLGALLEAQRSGLGQVVDASMVDGTALLLTMQFALDAQGLLQAGRGGNILDGGAPYYDTYETSDGRYMAVGSIEPRFFSRVLECLGLPPELLAAQDDRDRWPELREEMAAAFASRSQLHWTSLFERVDACVTPVLTMAEATGHRHNVERRTFEPIHGRLQPAPAPRFSRTPASVAAGPPHRPGEHTVEVLQEWLDLSDHEIGDLRRSGAASGLPG
jgi:alpha-methylacyl-CoA racemase